MILAHRSVRALATMIGLNLAARQRHTAEQKLVDLIAWCAFGARDRGVPLD